MYKIRCGIFEHDKMLDIKELLTWGCNDNIGSFSNSYFLELHIYIFMAKLLKRLRFASQQWGEGRVGEV